MNFWIFSRHFILILIFRVFVLMSQSVFQFLLILLIIRAHHPSPRGPKLADDFENSFLCTLELFHFSRRSFIELSKLNIKTSQWKTNVAEKIFVDVYFLFLYGCAPCSSPAHFTHQYFCWEKIAPWFLRADKQKSFKSHLIFAESLDWSGRRPAGSFRFFLKN